MIILGIETSCDETAAAVVTDNDKRITILSNVVASSAALQAKYGGVIPEQASREQLKSLIPVIEEALWQAFPKKRLPRRSPRRPPRNDKTSSEPLAISYSLFAGQKRTAKSKRPNSPCTDIDAIAVTYGPGLIGSLLVGLETAKTLAIAWNKPLIPVNHLIGHFYANWISEPLAISYSLFAGQKRTAKSEQPNFPCLGLLVSGGHTDLVLFKDHGKYKYLGGTRDDAAGECFDKCARLLELAYPGGPAIAKLARKGNPRAFDLPRPMIDSNDFDFSFSGLKTSVSNIVYGISGKQNDKRLTINDKRNLAASVEAAIVEVLVTKTIKAAKAHNVENIMIAGGVASNQRLTSEFKKTINDKRLTINLHIPPPNLCTDNAAMIAAAAFFNYHPVNPLILQADPNLSL